MSQVSGKKRPRDEAYWILKWDEKIAQVTAQSPCQISLSGRGSVRSRRRVSVNGYLLSRTTDWISFDCPPWAGWATLSLEKGDTVELKSCDGTITSEHEPTFRVWSAHDASARPTVIPPSWKQAIDTIEEDFWNTQRQHPGRRLLVHRESLEDDDEPSLPSQASSFKVAFCGGKSVGKSSCLRYCVNRLLSSRRKGNGIDAVAVLDADVGQPELGPPGMLTLSLCREPLLRQPYSHFLQSDYHSRCSYVASCFFGSVTAQTDPARYIRCISSLLQKFTAQENFDPVPPLLINMDGWVKGLGLEVLHAIIQETVPTHVVQILGSIRSNQFDLQVCSERTQLHVCQAFRPRTKDSSAIVAQKPDIRHSGSSTDDIAIGKTTNEDTDAQPEQPEIVAAPSASLSSASFRTLRLLAYFIERHSDNDDTLLQIWDRMGYGQTQQHGFLEGDERCELAHRLASARPYCVPMECVNLVFSNEELYSDIRSEEGVLNAFNGSIVGLLCRGESGEGTESRSVPPTCLGLGIVRAIDRSKRLIYILTPVSQDKLSSVNVLSLANGSLTVPFELLFRGVHAEAVPHLSFPEKISEALGVEPMKSRNSIARK